jgi:hypothetical protein
MRLLRLTTSDPQAIFNAQFSDDILFKKDSSIALQNVSIEAQASTITLTGQNNSINYRNSNAGNLSIDLNLGTYDGSNYTDLIDDIKNKLNESTGFTNAQGNFRELGMEWDADLDADNKVAIGYKIGKYITNAMFAKWSYDNTLVQRVTTDNGIWSRFAGLASSDTLESHFFFKNFIARGCGFTRGLIYTLETDGLGYNRNGFLVGLTTKDLVDKDPTDLTIADIKYGLIARITNAGVRNYRTIVNGVDTGIAEPMTYTANSNDNDVMELMIVGNKMKYFIYHSADGGVPTEVNEEAYTAGEKLYPVNVFFGSQANARMRVPTLTESPYVENPSDFIDEEDELAVPPIPRRNPSDNFLEFESQALAEFLGFENKRQPISGFYNVVEQTYTADDQFNESTKADAFLVESLTIPLDSYDSFVGQRKNLLAVIPESDANGSVIYEPSTPFFIDVKNENDLLLRNLRFRIVKADYTPFELRGLATLTILIS